MLHRILELSEARTIAAARTLILVNVGSSGSHWIEAMLAESPMVHPLGEVYFPKALRKQMAALSPSDASFVLNAIHLAHGKALDSALAEHVLINSAHVTTIDFYRTCLPGSPCVLLILDPIDVVVSRTFRKDAYRKFIAPDADDDEYLDRNIDQVLRFFDHYKSVRFDLRIRYEDFLEDASAALGRLAEVVGCVPSQDELDQWVEWHSRSRIQAGEVDDAANLYRGPEIRVSDRHQKRMTQRLGKLRRDLGYTDSR